MYLVNYLIRIQNKVLMKIQILLWLLLMVKINLTIYSKFGFKYATSNLNNSEINRVWKKSQIHYFDIDNWCHFHH